MPNKIIQGSEKHYMLCGVCEELFSEKERYFANHMFYPYHKEETEFNYDEGLFYFITSLSWRSLFLDLIDNTKDSLINIDSVELLTSAERKMKNYLLKKPMN